MWKFDKGFVAVCTSYVVKDCNCREKQAKL